jgi:hypothetical protein
VTASQIDFVLKGWRWQITDVIAREAEGTPYKYLGRCVSRVLWLNAVAGEYRFSLRPVRSEE